MREGQGERWDAGTEAGRSTPKLPPLKLERSVSSEALRTSADRIYVQNMGGPVTTKLIFAAQQNIVN